MKHKNYLPFVNSFLLYGEKMFKLIYLLSKFDSIKISVSRYVDITLFQKNNIIFMDIDNHSILYEKKNNTELYSTQMLEGILNIKQVRETVNYLYEQEIELAKEQELAKIDISYAIQYNNNIDIEQEIMFERILDAVIKNNKFQINKNTFLTLTDDSNKKREPFNDLHFQIVKCIKKGNNIIKEYPELRNEEIVFLIKKELDTNLQEIKNKLEKIERNCFIEQQKKEKVFRAIKEKYLGNNKNQEKEM